MESNEGVLTGSALCLYQGRQRFHEKRGLLVKTHPAVELRIRIEQGSGSQPKPSRIFKRKVPFGSVLLLWRQPFEHAKSYRTFRASLLRSQLPAA